jgi:ABC-type transport system involved in multi-copper enzyme maturation permease subunit
VSRIGLVAWHVFKESVRDRVLYAIGAFALVLVAASVLVGQLTAGQDVKIIKDLGLATIEIAGLLMTVFIGVGLVAREIDRRSIYSLLAKPLPRWEFILGKYAGLVLTIVVNVAAMTAALYLMLLYMSLTLPSNVLASLDAPPVDVRLLISVLLITAELALLTAIAVFFSTFSSSALWSTIFTLGLYVAGVESPDLRNFNNIVDAPAMAHVVSAIGWIIPAFSAFDVKDQVVHGLHVPAGLVLQTLAYAGVYIAVLLVAAVAIFSRREFK